MNDRLVNQYQGNQICGYLHNIRNSLYVNFPNLYDVSKVDIYTNDVISGVSFTNNAGSVEYGNIPYTSPRITYISNEAVNIAPGVYNNLQIICKDEASYVIDMQNNVANFFGLDVEIANTVISAARLFANARNFNGRVTIPDSVTNCAYMFDGCNNFNQPVAIPALVTDCNRMFASCANFNQPVTVPNSVTNCFYMFHGCTNFNQPVTIPNSVTDCYRMFGYCYVFNQTVTIPNSVTSCENMFEECRVQNSPIYVPSRFNNNGGVYGWSNVANDCIVWY